MYLLADQQSNAKISKNSNIDQNWQTSILYLAPADSSGTNICPDASPGCRAACLNTAGRGAMQSVQAGRLRKTRLFLDNRAEFMRQLVSDLETIARRQLRTGVKQAIRLNGTSDIAWEAMNCFRGELEFISVMVAFPQLQFYDYTKLPTRCVSPELPPNYHLTFSQSEVNLNMAKRLANRNVNVAVVFRGSMPTEYHGRPVLDGTKHDMRFLDKPGHIVGLIEKGRAKRDTTGFVVEVNCVATNSQTGRSATND